MSVSEHHMESLFNGYSFGKMSVEVRDLKGML